MDGWMDGTNGCIGRLVDGWMDFNYLKMTIEMDGWKKWTGS